MDIILPRAGEKAMDILFRCGGYYKCPKDESGKRFGPLVGYAGRDKNGKQLVGDIYANYSKAERHGPVNSHFCNQLLDRLTHMGTEIALKLEASTGFCGAPEGGKALATGLAIHSSRQYIFPQKKVIEQATANSREKTALVFDRHEPEKGEWWWITEDVCNNFSTTVDLVQLIESYKARVAGVVCFLNRSPTVDSTFYVRDDLVLPVIPVVRQPMDEWSQDDRAVKSDIESGNVVWKAKEHWGEMMRAMGQQ